MPTGNFEGAVQIGEWFVNPSRDTISKGTETQKLEPRTMRLLMCLADAAGEVVSVDRLLNEVWTGVVVGSASVYQAVSQLRKLLGDADPNPTYIATVPRKGYRLIAPVRRLEGPGESKEIAAVAGTPVAEAPAAEGPAIVALARKRKMPIILGVVVLMVLVVAGALLWKRSSTSNRLAAATNSIVVLPFIDMTAEKADQSFCDGLTEELSNWLAQIPTLQVVARTSAFAFRGQGEDVRKIGKALDTNHILEGSMRRSGDHMRVTVQLIDARTGYHLWSEDFDRPVADAIKMQEDISRSVAKTLQVRLTSDSVRQLAERRTSDPEAYRLYLLARYYQQQITPKSTDQAIDLYRQVLVADPKFAPAYVQLSNALLNQRQFRDLPVADVATEVEPLISAALRIDDRLSGAYAARGSLRAEQSRNKEALSDLQLAISLNPSDMGAIARIGRIQLFDGQPREALKSYDRAAALDPLNATLQIWRCKALDDVALYEAAATACERARILQPGSASVADQFNWLAESRGRIDEALRWNAESIKAEPTDDFDLYWNRATLFLSIGLAPPARAAVDLGLSATKEDIGAKAALVRVVYCEGGKDALRMYLSSVHLDQLPNAVTLQEAAYARLLLEDASAVKGLIERALLAPDRLPGFAESPWYARGERAMGISYRLDLAAAYLALGDRPGAMKELDIVLAMVNKMIAAGVERYGTYELRAKVYALQGKHDEAMGDLNTAVKLGFRRAWWAMHEPYLASLRTRSDFQALMTQVNRSNDQLIKDLKSASGYMFRPESVISCSANG
jgi:TolB-like protein/DNA-binding winged helix-turn-helix (wHTH) protein/tetratricopeptide (TPR) repeat protein